MGMNLYPQQGAYYDPRTQVWFTSQRETDLYVAQMTNWHQTYPQEAAQYIYSNTVSTSKKEKNMNLGNIAKRLLDADTKTLIKAGFLDTNLDITDSGRRALWGILFETHKAAFVAEAQAKLDDEAKK